MARRALIVKAGRPPKFSSRLVHRCAKCGRKRGYMRDFDLCRICFREMGSAGTLPGIKKASW